MLLALGAKQSELEPDLRPCWLLLPAAGLAMIFVWTVRGAARVIFRRVPFPRLRGDGRHVRTRAHVLTVAAFGATGLAAIGVFLLLAPSAPRAPASRSVARQSIAPESLVPRAGPSGFPGAQAPRRGGRRDRTTPPATRRTPARRRRPGTRHPARRRALRRRALRCRAARVLGLSKPTAPRCRAFRPGQAPPRQAKPAPPAARTTARPPPTRRNRQPSQHRAAPCN
jgi:hypothetical protein